MKWTVCLVVLYLADVSRGQSAGQKLATLADDFQTWRLKENPETATEKGVYTYNDQLSSYNVSRYDGYKVIVDGFYERLLTIEELALSKKDRVSYKVLDSHLKTYIDGYRWRFYMNLNPVTFLEGLLNDIQSFPSSVPTDTKGDVDNYIRRLQAWPQQIAEIEESMRVSMEHNTTNHNVSMTRLSSIFEKIFESGPKQSTLYIPFNRTVEMNELGYSGEERLSLIARAVTAVNRVITRLHRLQIFIENEYVTRSKIGVSSFKDGEDYYKAIMKWYLTVDLTPEKVHNTGKQEVARISNLMQQIMEKQKFTGSIKEYFASLMNQSKFFFNTSEQLLDGYRKQITEDIEPTLSKLFYELPGLPIVVKPMTSDGPLGTYDRGTPDGRKPGTFWVNALRPLDIPKFGMMAITMHETNPGHHLQISIAMTSGLPAFRGSIVYDPKFESPIGFTSFTSFSEGWALYSESLGEEVGLYKDDYELMGRYSSEIFRACRLVVDTGIHYFNWDRERAIYYVLNYTAFTRATAETEIDRYITWPGQALTYKIGELKIKEWRKKAETKLGSDFDIKEFHRVVLENGRMPLNVIEENVNDWLDSYVAMTMTPTKTCESSGSDLSSLYISMLFSILLVLRNMIRI